MPVLASRIDIGRRAFPFLRRKVNGKPIIYFDNAATTQKPQQVIDALCDFYSNHCANTHRAGHFLAEEATGLFENARAAIARFIGGDDREIVFLRNATQGIHFVSRALSRPGDVLVPLSEHHSNLLPWRSQRRVKYVSLNDDGTLDIDDFRRKLTGDVALVALSWVSNVLGNVNAVEDVIELAKRNGSLTCIDASQAVAHFPIDVHALGCDFLVFSGHKLYAPSGIGVLYGRAERLEELTDFELGGGSVKDVDPSRHLLNEIPWRFEAGTPNIEGAVGLGAAINFLDDIGFEWIEQHEAQLAAHALEMLRRVPGIQILGPPQTADRRIGIVSFTLPGIDSQVVARVAGDRENIMLRAGFHCAHLLHKHLGAGPTVRASFGVYNTLDEIDTLVEVLCNLRRAV